MSAENVIGKNTAILPPEPPLPRPETIPVEKLEEPGKEIAKLCETEAEDGANADALKANQDLPKWTPEDEARWQEKQKEREKKRWDEQAEIYNEASKFWDKINTDGSFLPYLNSIYNWGNVVHLAAIFLPELKAEIVVYKNSVETVYQSKERKVKPFKMWSSDEYATLMVIKFPPEICTDTWTILTPLKFYKLFADYPNVKMADEPLDIDVTPPKYMSISKSLLMHIFNRIPKKEN